jgi:hypothetical protein
LGVGSDDGLRKRSPYSFGGAAGVDFGGVGRVDLVEVGVGLRELVAVDEEAFEAVAGRDFVVVIHLDGIKGAGLDAELAAHADGEVDVEDLGFLLHAAFFVALGDDVDALGRAFFFADAAGDAAQAGDGVVAVVNEEGETAEVLREFVAFFRILDGGEPLGIVVAADEVFRRDVEAFDDAGAEHGRELITNYE